MLEEIFTKFAHQYFDGLAKKYNLKENRSTIDNSISYENDKVCLEICFDSRRSYELEVNIINKIETFKPVIYWLIDWLSGDG